MYNFYQVNLIQDKNFFGTLAVCDVIPTVLKNDRWYSAPSGAAAAPIPSLTGPPGSFALNRLRLRAAGIRRTALLTSRAFSDQVGTGWAKKMRQNQGSRGHSAIQLALNVL